MIALSKDILPQSSPSGHLKDYQEMIKLDHKIKMDFVF